MKAVDTSVLVAAFWGWHQAHETARSCLASRPSLPSQAALEAYSVLTRMPAPHRAPPAAVRDFLAANFRDPPLSLPAADLPSLIAELAAARIAGGATYDAYIAAIARHAGATLVTCDQRARPTYERLGVVVEYLAP